MAPGKYGQLAQQRLQRLDLMSHVIKNISCSNGLVQRTPCECSLTDEHISYIDDHLLDQLCLDVKISDICGEMNPLVFSALEEVNLVFILMMSSTVMVDIVFARFMFLHVLLEMTKPNNDILFVFFDYFDCTENIVRI